MKRKFFAFLTLISTTTAFAADAGTEEDSGAAAPTAVEDRVAALSALENNLDGIRYALAAVFAGEGYVPPAYPQAVGDRTAGLLNAEDSVLNAYDALFKGLSNATEDLRVGYIEFLEQMKRGWEQQRENSIAAHNDRLNMQRSKTVLLREIALLAARHASGDEDMTVLSNALNQMRAQEEALGLRLASKTSG